MLRQPRDGRDGRDGKRGPKGDPGRDGKDVSLKEIARLIEQQFSTIPVPKDGRDGLNGKDGRDGIDAKDGRDGIDGKDGRDGIDGKSIKGERGPKGPKGNDGKDGEDGLSAYEIWLDEGHRGTVQDFFEWLARKARDLLKKDYKEPTPAPSGGGTFTLPCGFSALMQSDSVLTSGIKGSLVVPYNMNIKEWSLLGDSALSGSCVVDIWLEDFVDGFPTIGDSITGSAKPTITSSNKAKSSSLTGWTKSLKKGQILSYAIISNTNFKNITLGLSGVQR